MIITKSLFIIVILQIPRVYRRTLTISTQAASSTAEAGADTMKTPSTTTLHLSIALISTLVLRVTAQVTCFAPDGVTIADNETYVPCNKLGITQQGVHSSCCRLDGAPDDRDLCASTGLCINNGVVSRGYCTDQTWKSPACVNVCTEPKVSPHLSQTSPNLENHPPNKQLPSPVGRLQNRRRRNDLLHRRNLLLRPQQPHLLRHPMGRQGPPPHRLNNHHHHRNRHPPTSIHRPDIRRSRRCPRPRNPHFLRPHLLPSTIHPTTTIRDTKPSRTRVPSRHVRFRKRRVRLAAVRKHHIIAPPAECGGLGQRE